MSSKLWDITVILRNKVKRKAVPTVLSHKLRRGDKKIKRKDVFYVYMVKCKNGTYYTGYTNNLENRIKLHNNGNGAKYLKGKSPVQLIYAKEYKYFKNALHAERNIKKLTRRDKELLIKNYENDPHRFVPNLNAGTPMSKFSGGIS